MATRYLLCFLFLFNLISGTAQFFYLHNLIIQKKMMTVERLQLIHLLISFFALCASLYIFVTELNKEWGIIGFIMCSISCADCLSIFLISLKYDTGKQAKESDNIKP